VSSPSSTKKKTVLKEVLFWHKILVFVFGDILQRCFWVATWLFKVGNSEIQLPLFVGPFLDTCSTRF
jgi:hypothetical protein